MTWGGTPTSLAYSPGVNVSTESFSLRFLMAITPLGVCTVEELEKQVPFTLTGTKGIGSHTYTVICCHAMHSSPDDKSFTILPSLAP